jgi:hypothetical protein
MVAADSHPNRRKFLALHMPKEGKKQYLRDTRVGGFQEIP